MNAVFGDTSAFLALLNAADENQDRADRDFATLRERKALLVSTLSLVDALSFVAMRQGNLSEAFAFDPHFEQEGFSIVN